MLCVPLEAPMPPQRTRPNDGPGASRPLLAGPSVIPSLQKLLFKRQNAPPGCPPGLTSGRLSSIVPQRGESRLAQLMLLQSLHAAGYPEQPPPPLPPLHGRHVRPAAGVRSPAACALQPFKLQSSSNPCPFCRLLYGGRARCRLRQGCSPRAPTLADQPRLAAPANAGNCLTG